MWSSPRSRERRTTLPASPCTMHNALQAIIAPRATWAAMLIWATLPSATAPSPRAWPYLHEKENVLQQGRNWNAVDRNEAVSDLNAAVDCSRQTIFHSNNHNRLTPSTLCESDTNCPSFLQQHGHRCPAIDVLLRLGTPCTRTKTCRLTLPVCSGSPFQRPIAPAFFPQAFPHAFPSWLRLMQGG